MILERTISIARPPNEVFDYVLDMRNEPKWHTDVLEVRPQSDARVGEGTVFAVRFKPMMGASEGTMTVVGLEPSNRIVLNGRVGKFAPTITHTFTPDDAGTRYTRRVEMTPPGIMRVMASLMNGMMGKQNDKFLANLKRQLEGS